MEQARYWMWVKTVKPDSNILSPAMINSYGDSWEEKAFAKDAAGESTLVWPPRSYSCSFCRREFRSAQALGGHMNVHRKDRAKLQQSEEVLLVPQDHALNTCTSQACTFLCDSNPNPEFSGSRVSSPPTTTLCFLEPLVHRNDVVSSHPPSRSSSYIAGKRDRGVRSRKSDEDGKLKIEQDSRADQKEDCVTGDFPTRLSLVVSRKQTNTCGDEEEIASSCKRMRRVEEKPLSLFLEVDRCVIAQSDVSKLNPGRMEEPDLELRLGDAKLHN